MNTTTEQAWKRCKRCTNVLMGNEQRSDTCNACLDRPFDPMNIDDAAYPDEVPHCMSCEENPAAEGDELCLPCAQARDAQPVIPDRYTLPAMLDQMARIGRPDLAALLAAWHCA